MAQRYVYAFDEARGLTRDLLGGKGASLAEMTAIGLPVPPGFTVTTEACRLFTATGRFPDGLEEEIAEHLAGLEKKMGKRFGDATDPLLVSVRSGAAISMPGMMDTILNLGLNDTTAAALAQATGNPRFAADCYRRFLQMFGDVVLKIDHARFEAILEAEKRRAGVSLDHQLDADALGRVIEAYKALIAEHTGKEFPQDPREQLRLAVRAVFESWENPRAVVYRKVNKIPDDLGTAVNVQAMVFGNLGEDSGTGVLFTRNPSTGAKELYGEYLMNAQGEDVVAGIRTPQPIAQLRETQPEVYDQVVQVSRLLEEHFRDVQDIEFTVERGRLFLLQCRNAKRTARAAVKIAYDLVQEGRIDREEALLRVNPEEVERLLHRMIDPNAQLEALAQGLPASPGAATGKVVFDADEAERRGLEGEAVILVRSETTPDDIHGIVQAVGILTSRGGMTSHAAVVARGMGKPCVAGCEALEIDARSGAFRVGDVIVREGDLISIDGNTGKVFLGAVPLVDPELSDEFRTLLEWADEVKTLGVMANADTPEDARRARELGATGIGLVRTEHMFMAADRLPVVQDMILARTAEERRRALDRLLPMQEEDFYGIFRAMDGYTVIIRLLDPPLHEFLPKEAEVAREIEELRQRGADPALIARKEEIMRTARSLAEFNPMLGFRGCRLGMIYPEINEMQARAIFRAQARLRREGGNTRVEVMIPLVGLEEEMRVFHELVDRVGKEVEKEEGVELDYMIGACIEVPRACLIAGKLARYAEFFSFGTNDLTQTAFGYSRDDAEGKFLGHYLEQKILPDDPFVVIDEEATGELIEIGIRRGRETRPNLEVGICGEQAGESRSIAFCHRVGMNYVSCSPFRVPIARLAAAQARIRQDRAEAGVVA